MQPSTLENLLQKITDNYKDTVILTPNMRLSRFLHRQFDQHQQTAAHQVFWLTPTIIPFNSWLCTWWNQQNHDFLLLNDNQEYAIWHEIINSSLDDGQFNSEIIELAREAWKLLNKWEMPLENLQDNPVEDIALFYKWAKTFERKLFANNWCVPSNILTLFLSANNLHYPHNLTNLPHKIILFGFEELSISPQEQRVFCLLNDKLNCKIEYLDPNIKSSLQQKISFLEQKQEILNMALWAHKLWRENPALEIGCIIPNLVAIKSQVEHSFKEVFAVDNHSTTTHPPFNISVGEPLHHYPIIHVALQIIALFFNTKNIDTLGQLLTSPFIANSNAELTARTILKNNSREYYKYRFELSHFLNKAQKTCPIFANILHEYLKITAVSSKRKHSPSKWLKIFTAQLQLFGWLEERPLDSAEYQTIQRWQQTLKEFATLDYIFPRINHQDAIEYLNTFIKKNIFQPQTLPTSINILGTLEAAGLNFDRIWLMGMNENLFPPAAKPNPFLPINLQKKLNLPSSSSERELNFCHNLIQRFSRSAEQIIYSYAKKEDEQDLRMTPLIVQISEIEATELNLEPYQTIAHKIQANSKLEQFVDDTAPPLLADEKITGGTKILEQQSLCPFAAFATYRLHAKTVNTNSLKTTRGILIHETLKQIWRLIKNKNNLQHLSVQELQNIITQYLNQSIKELEKSQKMLLCDSHLELEQQCLTKLLSSWLQKEQENYAGLFFEVIETEKDIEFTIEQITLKLRIDRIDKVESLGAVIIDYKTGKPPTKSPASNWNDERPTNIQLPLYCLALNENLVGLIFAQIHVISMCNNKYLQGWLADEKLKTDKKSNNLSIKTTEEWQKIKEEWRTNLTKLAKEFCQGYALVAPKNPKETCKYCELEILCRVRNQKTEYESHISVGTG